MENTEGKKDVRNVKINIPYLMEIIEKTGKSKTEFARDVLLRGGNYIFTAINAGSVSPMMVDVIARQTGCDREKLTTYVPYNPEDYKPNKLKKKERAKDEVTLADYVKLMADGVTEIAKNQKELDELMITISKLTADNRKFADETGKLLAFVVEKLNRMEKNIDSIHAQIR